VIPKFETCLICDLVREEPRRKLSILGFFGVCPRVEVSVPYLDQAVSLTFLLVGSPGDGQFTATIELVDKVSNRIVASGANISIRATPKAATSLGLTLLPTFGRAGVYALKCQVGSDLPFEALFHVSQAPLPVAEPA
jgi:hypothetical protein